MKDWYSNDTLLDCVTTVMT